MTRSQTPASAVATYAATLYAERVESFTRLASKLNSVVHASDSAWQSIGHVADDIAAQDVRDLERTVVATAADIRVLGDAVRFFRSLPVVDFNQPAPKADRWMHYCHHRDKNCELSLGNMLHAGWHAPRPAQEDIVAININPLSKDIGRWSASNAIGRITVLRELLVEAITRSPTGNRTQLAMPAFVDELHDILATTLNSALTAIVSALYLDGQDVTAMDANIRKAGGRLALPHIALTLKACRKASTALLVDSAATAEAVEWSLTGAAAVTHLFDNVVFAILSLCAFSKDACPGSNLHVRRESDKLSAEIGALRFALREAAHQTAERDPEHSGFARWIARNGARRGGLEWLEELKESLH